MFTAAMVTTATATKMETGLRVEAAEVKIPVEVTPVLVTVTVARRPVVEMWVRRPVVETVRRPVVETVRRPVVETVRRPVVETVRRPVVETWVEEVVHLEEDPKTNPEEHLPEMGPFFVASTHFLVAPHQPQKESPTQLLHDLNSKQSTAKQLVKNHWVQFAATPPGPFALPARQRPVVSHQPQPSTRVQSSQFLFVEQST